MFFLCISLLCSLVLSSKTCKKEVIVSDLPDAPISAATKTENGLVFISGQIGFKDGKLVSDNIEEQTEQALINLIGIAKDFGSSIDNILKTTVLMTDINDFPTVNAVYAKMFKDTQFPARSAYAVSTLPLGAKVEIEAMAQTCKRGKNKKGSDSN